MDDTIMTMSCDELEDETIAFAVFNTGDDVWTHAEAGLPMPLCFEDIDAFVKRAWCAFEGKPALEVI